MVEYFRVGVIANTHGVRGEVKVFPTTDDVSRFNDLKEVYLDTVNGYEKLNIKGVKYVKNLVVLKFEEFDNINQVLGLKNKELYVDREHAIPLKEGEFYVADMIGAKVITDEGNELGKLTSIFKTGANDVYVVKNENGKEILLPSIPECILEKNVEEKIITVHIMKGLID